MPSGASAMTIILKHLDQLGFSGYGITLSCAVWSRLNTHGQITDKWEPKKTRAKRGVLYVRLQVGGSTAEDRVAGLMIEAAFGKIPTLSGFRLRYHNGDKSDCRLVNLAYAPRARYSALALDGAKYAKSLPPGFAPEQV